VVKDQIFHFKLTPEQHDTILAGAKCLDVSASELVRAAAVETASTVLKLATGDVERGSEM